LGNVGGTTVSLWRARVGYHRATVAYDGRVELSFDLLTLRRAAIGLIVFAETRSAFDKFGFQFGVGFFCRRVNEKVSDFLGDFGLIMK
jgi:hypothetical protein